jgi:hypothetical protein
MTSHPQDTPQDINDNGLLSESSTLILSPREPRRLEYGESAGTNEFHVEEDDEFIQQREKEEVLYSLYEIHNIPANLPLKITPAKKMVHLIDQALNTHDTYPESRRTKYAKSMPNLNIGMGVNRLIESLNPYGETVRSKSCSNVEAFCDSMEEETTTPQHTLASIKNSIHISPSFHVKQQQRARWVPGVTYIPLLVAQYVWHPFYALWKNLSTEEGDSASPSEPSMEHFTMADEQDDNNLVSPNHNEDHHHTHRHHHKHHHHHHHHNDESNIFREKEEQVFRPGATEWKYSSAQKISASYVPGGDLFLE